jgi:hypothetical protein
MKRFSVLLWLAWIAFLSAWFLPVEGSASLSDGALPGWEALKLALGIWNDTDGSWHWTGLGLASGATNVVMVASPYLLWRTSSTHTPKWLGALLLVCGVLNTIWAWPDKNSDYPMQLHAGYWVWLSSFFAAGLAIVALPSRDSKTTAA